MVQTLEANEKELSRLYTKLGECSDSSVKADLAKKMEESGGRSTAL